MDEVQGKPYVKPTLESESAFTVLAAACGLADPGDMAQCDPDAGAFTMENILS